MKKLQIIATILCSVASAPIVVFLSKNQVVSILAIGLLIGFAIGYLISKFLGDRNEK